MRKSNDLGVVNGLKELGTLYKELSWIQEKEV